MQLLYYDCASGIRADINLAAMMDLGVSENYLIQELSKLNLNSKFSLKVRRVNIDRIKGNEVKIIVKNCLDIKICSNKMKDIIKFSKLNDSVKVISLNMLQKVIQGKLSFNEKSIHEVYFKEKEFIAYIVNIVAIGICLDKLNVDKIMASTIELGGGFVNRKQGLIPIPRPDTIGLLKGIPVSFGKENHELTDYIGAAFIAANVLEFNDNKNIVINKIGYGIGATELEKKTPLKIYLGKVKSNQVCILECNIYDMNPEIYNYIVEKLYNQGALDVHHIPIFMKKNSLGETLRVICNKECKAKLKEIILKETSAMEIIEYKGYGTRLHRDFSKLSTIYGEVGIKNAYFKGCKLKYKAEYEDCKRLSKENDVSIKYIYDEVIKNY